MLAAERLNHSDHAVYGIVTDAEIWQYGQLEGFLFTKKIVRGTIDNLPAVLSGVFAIMELATQAQSHKTTAASCKR